MHRGAQWATVHGVTKSQTQLNMCTPSLELTFFKNLYRLLSHTSHRFLVQSLGNLRVSCIFLSPFSDHMVKDHKTRIQEHSSYAINVWPNG